MLAFGFDPCYRRPDCGGCDLSNSGNCRLLVVAIAMPSTSSFQCLCLIILFFVPESPRWLVHQGRLQDALISVASTHSDSDIMHPVAIVQHEEIMETIEMERASGKQMTYAEIFRTPNSRLRLLLVVSVAVLSMSSGNIFFQNFNYLFIYADRNQETISFLTIWATCWITRALPIQLRSCKL